MGSEQGSCSDRFTLINAMRYSGSTRHLAIPTIPEPEPVLPTPPASRADVFFWGGPATEFDDDR